MVQIEKKLCSAGSRIAKVVYVLTRIFFLSVRKKMQIAPFRKKIRLLLFMNVGEMGKPV